MSTFVPPANYPTYLGFAIAATLLCSPPTGVVALLFSLQVRRRQAMGDDDRAWRYSQLAKLWCRISFFIGIAVYVGVFMWLMFSIGELWGY